MIIIMIYILKDIMGINDLRIVFAVTGQYIQVDKCHKCTRCFPLPKD